MDPEERFDILARNAEEIVTPQELKELLQTIERPKAYIGFEPSGLVHLGWVICADKVRDFIKVGFDITIFFADWHAYINDKLGGDIEAIRLCARYMEECFEALGVPRDKITFMYATDLMDDIDYWTKVIAIGKNSTLSRIKRAMTIMGREESEAEIDTSKIMYPMMQAADIFALDVDVAYAGIDQRRVHMLAREVAEKLGWKKPVALHTPLLPGLKGREKMDPVSAKMSKSDPDSGIIIHDSPEEIRRKILKAFCPPEVDGNPILAIAKMIVFNRKELLRIERPEKFGGPVEFKSYQELESAYSAGELHPMDLKNGIADSLIELLAPVREYFSQHPQNLEKLKSLLE